MPSGPIAGLDFSGSDIRFLRFIVLIQLVVRKSEEDMARKREEMLADDLARDAVHTTHGNSSDLQTLDPGPFVLLQQSLWHPRPFESP